MCSQLLCLAPRYSPAAKEMPSSPQDLQRARDVVPDKMPFYTPMDLLFRRNAPKQAAMDEAIKHDWPMNIAIVDSGANLVAFLRMDGALLASIAVAEQKARTAAKFRRPTKALEDAIQKLD